MTNYWKSLSIKEREKLAESVGTTTEYLRQVFMYGRNVGAVMAQKIEKITGIPRYELRPDIYPPSEFKNFSTHSLELKKAS